MSELKKLIKSKQALLPCYRLVNQKGIKIAASFEQILREKRPGFGVTQASQMALPGGLDVPFPWVEMVFDRRRKIQSIQERESFGHAPVQAKREDVAERNIIFGKARDTHQAPSIRFASRGTKGKACRALQGRSKRSPKYRTGTPARSSFSPQSSSR